MSDRPEFLHPDFEPGEFDRVERQLRQALARDAARVHPHDRLDAILHEAHVAGPAAAAGAGRARRWLPPLAAAAAVAVVVGGLWWGGRDHDLTPTPPQGSGSSQASLPSGPATSSAAPTTGTPTGTSTTSGPVATQQVSLPVYFVGPIGDDKPTYRLFREFVRARVPVDASPADKAEAALRLALDAQPYSNTDGYLQPWSGQSIRDVSVSDRLITVDLATPGATDAVVGEEQKRLAVQELVWTAQAAVQRGNLPVRITVRGEPARLFGSVATDGTFARPAADRLYEDLAPIWVTEPGRDATVPAGTPVTVKGLAIVFEAHLNWELRRGATKVDSGFTTASVGAPAQGTYEVELGRLPAGQYTVRVFAPSMEGGDRVAAEDSVSFSVR